MRKKISSSTPDPSKSDHRKTDIAFNIELTVALIFFVILVVAVVGFIVG